MDHVTAVDKHDDDETDAMLAAALTRQLHELARDVWPPAGLADTVLNEDCRGRADGHRFAWW